MVTLIAEHFGDLPPQICDDLGGDALHEQGRERDVDVLERAAERAHVGLPLAQARASDAQGRLERLDALGEEPPLLQRASLAQAGDGGVVVHFQG